MPHDQTMLVVGHARLPQNIPARAVFDTLFIVCRVDRKYGVVISTEINLVATITKEFISNLLVGYSLRDSPDKICNQIRDQFHGMSAAATIAAVRDVFKRYDMVVSGVDESSEPTGHRTKA